MFGSRGPGFPSVERDDDAFTSVVDPLIFPASQTAGFDFSRLAADGHQSTPSGLQSALLRSPYPSDVTTTTLTLEFADTTVQAAGTSALTFTLHNVGGVTPGSQAEAGFERAASLWESFLSDAVTIRLDVGFSSSGPASLDRQARPARSFPTRRCERL